MVLLYNAGQRNGGRSDYLRSSLRQPPDRLWAITPRNKLQHRAKPLYVGLAVINLGVAVVAGLTGYTVLGAGVGKSRDEIMTIYPRHKAFLDGFTTRGEVVGVEGMGRYDAIAIPKQNVSFRTDDSGDSGSVGPSKLYPVIQRTRSDRS